ncbi:MAG: FAD binding domain-containing protein [Anaerolineaceae bacterium]|nr:FAD binding domain-containing protein [Anaerolineaceae bacterium]
MWHEYRNATSLDEVLRILDERKERARIVAGATDLILEMERGVRKGIDTLIDITRIPGIDQIIVDEDGIVHLGALVTHNQVADSDLSRRFALPLVQAAWEVGSPQIRNRGTIAGNVITASPANDTICPLIALDAQVLLRSMQGERRVPLSQFYTGVRRTVMHPDEMLLEITFQGMDESQHGKFIKLALRQAQAISLVNVCIILGFENGLVNKAAIALGSVAPTIVRAPEAENFLIGKPLDPEVILQTAELTKQASRPISDVRGSAGYRRAMVKVITRRAMLAITRGEEAVGLPAHPVLLAAGHDGKVVSPQTGMIHAGETPITTQINGKQYTFVSGQNKTLLRLLREEAGLIGAKEGCSEGECGACTVFLDGQAVMSCMVPASRADGAEIVTIEGLSQGDRLHPVQQAFIDAGAVQCGYCTPGFLMSAAKLLEERLTPTQEEIRQAITGNLCRCTGYYKIIEAIEQASGR